MAKKKTTSSVEPPSPKLAEEPTPPKGKGSKPMGRPRKPRTPEQEAKEQARELAREQARKAKQAEVATRYKAKDTAKRYHPWLLEKDPSINDRLLAVLDSLDGGLSNEERLFKGLLSGVPIEIACDYAGISRKTYFNWQEKYNKDPDNCPEQIALFVRTAKAIQSYKAIKAQELWWKIIEEGKGNFVPICTYLERTQNEFYSQNKQKTENIQIHASTVIQTKTAQEAAERYQKVSAEYKKQEEIKAIDVEPIKEDDIESTN